MYIGHLRRYRVCV